jgi:RNA polymerase sigma-70 factor (ECF subfamily)
VNTPQSNGIDINSLYRDALKGDLIAEHHLFDSLLVRFRLFANQRIWDMDDAEDIVQNALTAIAREYRETKISTSFSSWAYRVLDNRIMSYIQSKSRRARIVKERATPDNGDKVYSSAPDPGLRLRLLDCLRKVGKVNTRYARVLNFSYQGYRTDEICERLEVTPNNLYVILSRSRSMLEKCLESGDVD